MKHFIVTCRHIAKRFSEAYGGILLDYREESRKDLVTGIDSSGIHAFDVATYATSTASIQSAFKTITKGLHSTELTATCTMWPQASW